MFPDVERCFRAVDPDLQIVVFPEQCDYKNYIFIVCGDDERAAAIQKTLNGEQPDWLKQSTAPFYITFASKSKKT